MLTKIELTNFKSFLHVSLEMKPLTVLTGLNNCGKSSVIQAINMLFRYYYSQNQDVALPDHVSPRLLRTNQTKDKFFILKIYTDTTGELELKVSIDGEKYSFDKRTAHKKIPEIRYISASRLGPENVLKLNPESNRAEIGAKGEFVIDYIDQNKDLAVHERLIKDKNELARLWDNINAWLQYISPGTILSYEIIRDQNASFPKYNGILPTETGFGLSYTLPMITALLAPAKDEGSVLLLENPEAHLHPQGQTAMGELIALAASTGKQIILETHSDHVIDGIRIAARRRKIKHSDVVFHYFTREDPESETTVEPPILQEDGKLSSWPKGFFDQNLINKAELIKK